MIVRRATLSHSDAPFQVGRSPATRQLDFSHGQSNSWTLDVGGGGVTIVELDAVESGDFSVTVASPAPIGVSVRALADFNIDPAVGPSGDVCGADVSTVPPVGADPWVLHIRGYDPADCEGVAVAMVNQDWDSREMAPVDIDVSFSEVLGLPITFSEVPLGTAVSDQYASLGVIFGGDSPYTASDGSNPTSPVLSGTPVFQGSITMEFVTPGTGTPATVDFVEFDVGFIDDAGGVAVTTYDLGGGATSTTTYGCCGIVHAIIDTADTHRVEFDVRDFERLGSAIDNVSFG